MSISMNMIRPFSGLILALATLSTLGCSGDGVYDESAVTSTGEPAYITIQHCLVGVYTPGEFEDTQRSAEAAEQLAKEIYEKALAGEDFDGLVRQYTDDSRPGIYMMANAGFPGDRTSKMQSRHITPRSDMVPAFGDVGFSLDAGAIGLAPFDLERSKYGWHIIKRLR